MGMGLPEILAGKSTLTVKQVESLQTYLKCVRGEMRLREAAFQRSGKPVTVGSYYRTVQQGREKTRESMNTILIGLWIGLIKLEDVRRLFEYVGRSGGQLPENDIEKLAAVLQTLTNRIVT